MIAIFQISMSVCLIEGKTSKSTGFFQPSPYEKYGHVQTYI